jgi:hypothetical protein
MDKDEALKLALEALEESETNNDTMEFWDRKTKAITAIKQALAAQPAVQEPVAWHDKIMGMEVSMDVSTGDDDIDHRVYGQVYEVILAHEAGPDVILAIESERNFTTPPAAQPAVPEGWKLVPVEPTHGMVKAFQDAMSLEFGMRTTAGYHARVYSAMLATAPEKGQP